MLTPSDRDIDIVAALRDWAANVPLAEIAAKQNVPPATMRRWIANAGGKPRQTQRPKANVDIDAIVAEYRDGSTIQEIAERHGANWGTIRSRLEAAGCELRPVGHNLRGKWVNMWRDGNRSEPSRHDEPQPTPRQAVAMDFNCPKCGVKPGRRCEWRNGLGELRNAVQPHRERRRLAATPGTTEVPA